MSSSDGDALWHEWEAILRSWGHDVQVQPGAYGANNGLVDYVGGNPAAWLMHHFVCSLNPELAAQYVAMLVNGYATSTDGGFLPGPVVPTAVDSLGRIYLIATRPANHAGAGSDAVLADVLAGVAPAGAAATYNPGNGSVKNDYYGGTELLHPGDSTPYPDAMISSFIDVAAAYCIAFNRSPATVIGHLEATDRKDDPSWHGGVSGTPGIDSRALVTDRVARYHSAPTDDWDTMTQDQFNGFMDGYLNSRAVVGQKWNPSDPAPDLTIPAALGQIARETTANWTRLSAIEAHEATDKN